MQSNKRSAQTPLSATENDFNRFTRSRARLQGNCEAHLEIDAGQTLDRVVVCRVVIFIRSVFFLIQTPKKSVFRFQSRFRLKKPKTKLKTVFFQVQLYGASVYWR